MKPLILKISPCVISLFILLVCGFGEETNTPGTNQPTTAPSGTNAAATGTPSDQSGSTNNQTAAPDIDISKLPPEDLPKEVTLKNAAEFQMLDDGKPIGSFKMQAGKTVHLLEVKGNNLHLGDASGEATIPYTDTDICDRVAAIRKQRAGKTEGATNSPSTNSTAEPAPTTASKDATSPSAPAAAPDPDLQPGANLELQFPKLEVDRYGKPAACHVLLPKDYDPAKKYGLAVWLAGGMGGNQPNPNLYPDSEFIGVGLPFPKGKTDDYLKNVAADYPNIWIYQRTMIDEVLKKVPNIEKGKGILAGFSNGSHTIDLIIRIKKLKGTNVTDYFNIFVVASGGLFSTPATAPPVYPSLRKCFAYVCWGEKEDGGNGSIRVAKLCKDAGATLVTSAIKGGDHAFPDSEQGKVKEWIETKVLPALKK